MEYVYSLNSEDWADYDDILCRINDENEAGSVVKVYKGEKIDQHHSDFINVDRIVEDFQESAYDVGGEFAD